LEKEADARNKLEADVVALNKQADARPPPARNTSAPPLQIDVEDKDKLIDQLHQANIGLAYDIEQLKKDYAELEDKVKGDAIEYRDALADLDHQLSGARAEKDKNQALLDQLLEQLANIKAIHDWEEHSKTAGRLSDIALVEKLDPALDKLRTEIEKLKGLNDALTQANKSNKDMYDNEFQLRVGLEKQLQQMRDQLETEHMLRLGLEKEVDLAKEKIATEEEFSEKLRETAIEISDGSSVVPVEPTLSIEPFSPDLTPVSPKFRTPFSTQRKYLLRRRSSVCDVLGCHHKDSTHTSPANPFLTPPANTLTKKRKVTAKSAQDSKKTKSNA